MSKNTKSRSRVSIQHLESVDFRTLADDVAQRDNWLVEPLIPAHRSTAIVAQGGVGKSLIMLEIAAALATGREVLQRPAESPVPVVYIDMEMTQDDLAERLTSLGYDFTNDKKLRKNLHYYQLQGFKPLDTPTGGKQLLAIAQKHDAQLVVIDTLAGVVDGEENSADTYRKYASNTGGPLKAAGITVARLDHLGKDKGKGARGSSAKRDDVDVSWTMTQRGRQEGALRFTLDKSRVGWIPKQVDIVRQEKPDLRHSVDEQQLTKKAQKLVKELDMLQVPNNYGRDRTRKALEEADVQASNADIDAAVKLRKARSGQAAGQDSWKTTGQA